MNAPMWNNSDLGNNTYRQYTNNMSTDMINGKNVNMNDEVKNNTSCQPHHTTTIHNDESDLQLSLHTTSI